jgi:hypothetical protein
MLFDTLSNPQVKDVMQLPPTAPATPSYLGILTTNTLMDLSWYRVFLEARVLGVFSTSINNKF